MQLTSKKYNAIRGYLNNTIEKLKGVVRRNESMPTGDEFFLWFEKQCPFQIKKDKAPQWNYDEKSQFYDAFFNFDGLRFYLGLSYEWSKYRSREYIDFSEQIYDIDELDPDEYNDKQIIEWLKENSRLKLEFPKKE